MSIELLSSTKTEHWVARQAVVFDWYDGPRHGVCALAAPECEFVFDLLAERIDPAGLDDRLFRLRALPLGSIQRVLSVVSSFGIGTPNSTVWVPVWQFQSEADKKSADCQIDEILASAIATDLVLLTKDMRIFLATWRIANIESLELEDLEWFDRLGIPRSC